MSNATDNTAEQVTALLAAGDESTLTTTRDAAAGFIMPLLAAGVRLVPVDPAEDEKRPLWGMSHANASRDREMWSGWIDTALQGGTPWGLGMAVGPLANAGALIVLDADTPDEVRAAKAMLERWGFDPAASPTVRTPGRLDGAHRDGGHWHIFLPDAAPIMPAALPTEITMDAAGRTGSQAEGATAALFIGGRQVLIPPTRREAGPYTVDGPVLTATPEMEAWLSEVAESRTAEVAAQAQRRAERAGAVEDRHPGLPEWEEQTSWASILEPAGWTETGVDPACGCTQWMHPEASSPKSSTAHDCARGTYLHTWSKSSTTLGAGSWSKIAAKAALHHGGDFDAAYRAAGIPAQGQGAAALDLQAAVAVLNPSTQDDGADAKPTNLDAAREAGDLADALASLTRCRREAAASVVALLGPDTVREDQGRLVRLGAHGLETLARSLGTAAATAYEAGDEAGDYEPDAYDIVGAGMGLDELYDDTAPAPTYADLFYKQGVHIVAGPGGSGKTWLSLSAAIPLILPEMDFPDYAGPRPHGLYIDMDHNRPANLARRAAALGCGPDRMLKRDLRLASPTSPADLDAILRAVTASEQLPTVVVVDSLTQLMAAEGGDTNSDASVTATLRRFVPLAEKTCVIILDHVGKADSDRPRGSSAKIDAVDVVLSLRPMPLDAERYPNTRLHNHVAIVKDRHSGLVDALTAPGEPRHAGTWTLDATGLDMSLPVGSVGGRTARLIPARISAEKREREQVAEEKAQTESAPIRVAEVIRKAGGEVTSYKGLLAALRKSGDGMTRAAAEAAIETAVEAGAVDRKRAGRSTVYALA